MLFYTIPENPFFTPYLRICLHSLQKKSLIKIEIFIPLDDNF